jgi:hypothetical protein
MVFLGESEWHSGLVLDQTRDHARSEVGTTARCLEAPVVCGQPGGWHLDPGCCRHVFVMMTTLTYLSPDLLIEVPYP